MNETGHTRFAHRHHPSSHHRTAVVVIGGGPAGLCVSRCLTDDGIDHVVLEAGRIVERWRSERWDSLRLLTPNRQLRFPGWSYAGDDPDGFMTAPELVAQLEEFAASSRVPVVEGARVSAVRRAGDGYTVDTADASWTAGSVVIATGANARPDVPPMARCLSDEFVQVTADEYRSPRRLRAGGVLVVGASSTGVQLADELARSGRRVTLAVGSHGRLPRRYRGADIMTWLERIGAFDDRVDQLANPSDAMRARSNQLVGSDPPRDIGLDTVQDLGVRLVGRLTAVADATVRFGDNLPGHVEAAESKMQATLDRIDRFIEANHLAVPPPDRPAPVPLRPTPAVLDLRAEGIETVLWATGYRRDYSWLHVPVVAPDGELIQQQGITPSPGLYVIGLRFLRHRNSHFLSGLGRDARAVVDHIGARRTTAGSGPVTMRRAS